MGSREPKGPAAAEAPAKAAAAPAPPQEKPATVRGRMWAHGGLSWGQDDGTSRLFAAGEKCELPAEIAAQLGEAFIPDAD